MSRSSRQALIGLGLLTALLVAIVTVSATLGRRDGLKVDVLSTRRAEPGEAIVITVSTRDTRGVATRVEVDFGDGSPVERRSRPGCADATVGATSETFDFDHTYADSGVFTVTAEVVSGCTGARETDEAVRTIQVKPLRR
ncbi:MAG TPA: PKD domain-containing protein [Acidimicrobiales bacterium]|nr:PKD domain-containing protein [Acidimicrobiales bacterium]